IGPSKESNNNRDRIKPHLVRPCVVRKLSSQEWNGKQLSEKLHENSGSDQCGHEPVKLEEREHNRDETQNQKGNPRIVLRRMQFRKRTKEIAVDGCRIRNSRITQKQREYGSKGGPENKNGD